MSQMSLSTLVTSVGGKISGDAVFADVSTDSRNVKRGALYVALKGENFNGNEFVESARDNGAVAAVVNEPQPEDFPHITVDDTRKALGLIARENRRLFEKPVVALTGSAGKTTCKEMVTSILLQAGDVLATRGNLNNEIGVPLTLLAIEPHHQYAVVEMGASQQGDIAYLCQFAEPDVVLVTNAMPAHMQSFGSLEAVASTKGEIFESLAGSGVAIINQDDFFASQWREQAGDAQIIGFSTRDACADVFAGDINVNLTHGLQFTLCYQGREQRINLSLLGAHNVANALAASAACLALGVDLDVIKAGLESVEAVSGRLKRLKGKEGRLLIDDSYNANPGAVKAAIDALSAFGSSTCLALGNMAELGERAEQLHYEIGCYARDKGVGQLLVTGEFGRAVVEGFGEGAVYFEALDLMLNDCEKYISSDVILVKGSRSAGMERLVNKLKIDGGEK